MKGDATHTILYLDDLHAGDVLFLQSLARGLARKAWNPAPVMLHGSGEHAERLLEAHGIFRVRSHGVLQLESAREHALVERALRGLNQKLVALLTDAVVSSVGIVGAEQHVFAIRKDRLHAPGASAVGRIAEQGVVPVVAASAVAEGSSARGEVSLEEATSALAGELGETRIIFFTKTNLPGVMKSGTPRDEVSASDPAIVATTSDPDALRRLAAAGHPILLTNSNRVADAGGSHIV